MTITVCGAGAIGGVTGAALVQPGHDVLLVDRAVDHVTAMSARGLTIDRGAHSLTVPVRAITPDALGTGLELVLLAFKSKDPPAALEVLAPRRADDGAIVSLQNGLNEELIAARVGARRTVGCLVNWAADWTGPGRIRHGGQGALRGSGDGPSGHEPGKCRRARESSGVTTPWEDREPQDVAALGSPPSEARINRSGRGSEGVSTCASFVSG